MAEVYTYWSQNVYGENGAKIDVARFRGERGKSRSEVAVFRGTGKSEKEAGKVRRMERSAAGRGAARNPAMRNNRY